MNILRRLGLMAKPTHQERVSLANLMAEYERKFGPFTVRGFWDEVEQVWWYGVIGETAFSIKPTVSEAILEVVTQISENIDVLFPEWVHQAWRQ